MSKIIACPNCGQKNRIDESSDTSQPICAKCWTKLNVPKKTVHAPPPPPPPPKDTGIPADNKNTEGEGSSFGWVWLLIIGGFIWWVAAQDSGTTSTTYSSGGNKNKPENTYVETTPSYSKATIPDKNKNYSLTVRRTPKTARVRILNIKPKYQDGIKLKKGKYHIEVSQSGYKTVKKWVTLSKDSVFNISLSFPKVSMPRNGALQLYTSDKRMAPFEIRTSHGANYLVKLVSAYTQDTVMTIFVKGGTTISTKVPLGTYEVKYATGTEWYGYKHLFGPDTGYSKAESIFTFENTGYQISGYTITLYRVSNGNLRTSTISPSQF